MLWVHNVTINYPQFSICDRTVSKPPIGRFHCIYTIKKVKVKLKWIYIAPSRETSKALRHGSHSVTCNYTDACLYLVSVHQMAPPQTEVANI